MLLLCLVASVPTSSNKEARLKWGRREVKGSVINPFLSICFHEHKISAVSGFYRNSPDEGLKKVLFLCSLSNFSGRS